LEESQTLTKPIGGVFLFGAIPDALTAGVMDQDADS